jgi:hypothetical protein
MKRLLFFLPLLLTSFAFGQQMPDIGLYKVRIITPEKIIVAGIYEVSAPLSAKPGLFYAWYSANQVHATQGGYSGRLLDGPYIEYYLDKNLKEEGFFKKGLKNGTWKSWNEDGTLKQTDEWKNGSPFIRQPFFLWKKLHFLKRKAHPDTLVKPVKSKAP